MADETGAQPVGGGSRLFGTNDLQNKIDNLTNAVQQLTNKIGSAPTWTGSGASFSPAPLLNQVSPGGNAGSPTVGGGGNALVAGGGTPTMNQTAAGGGANGGWGSAILGAASGAASSGLASAAANFGSGQLGTMAGISAYLQQGSVFGGNRQFLMNQAGFGTSLNDIATSASDAAQGQSLINFASGAYSGQNALSRGMMGGANMIGIVNPLLGYTGSAALAQQLYSPQMSMRMMMLGYGMTPRTMSGGTNSIQAINAAILQRTFQGRSRVNQSVFNSSAAPGGRLYANLTEGLGLGGQDLTNFESVLSAQNMLANKGYSNSQIQGIFAGARVGNQTSLNQLQAAGISASSIAQVLKNKTAIQTQRAGTEEQGFEAGLRQSVGLLNDFNKALNRMLSGPLGRFIGYTGGIGGSGIIGAASDFLSGNFMGGLKSILGGGAAAVGPKSSGGTKTTKTAPSGPSGAAMSAVGWAKQELGVPYMWGGEQPGIGFDCSGLTQWAYAQAGIKIPRTSQQQWAALAKGHSVPLNQVMAGDLIFSAGSGDGGTFDAPGHVAIMADNGRTLIQAPYTGANVEYTAYDPRQWDHAARPTGPGVGGTGPSANSSSSGGNGMFRGMGGGFSESGTMGSVEEIDAVSTALGGGFMGGMKTGTPGSRSPGTPGAGAPTPGNVSGNAALGKKLAAKRGWTGVQWNDLYALWNRESGWSNTARNASDAYGIAQALGHGPTNQYPGGRYQSANPPPFGSSDPTAQILWGLDYIGGRYQNPAGAWAHEQAQGWYARGTMNSNPGWAIVGEEGREAVRLPGGSQVLTAGQTAGMLAQIQSGQGKALRGGSGVALNINIGTITVGMGGSDASDAGREVAMQIARHLEQEAIIKKLAMGVSC